MHSPSDVATFNGQQETPDCAPWFGVPFNVWTLTLPVQGLHVGSTYAETSVRRALCLEALRARQGDEREAAFARCWPLVQRAAA